MKHLEHMQIQLRGFLPQTMKLMKWIRLWLLQILRIRKIQLIFLPGKMPDLHMLSQMVCLLSEFFRLNEHSGQGFTNAKKPGSWDQNLTTPHQAVILKVAGALPVDGEPPYMVTEVTAGLGS